VAGIIHPAPRALSIRVVVSIRSLILLESTLIRREIVPPEDYDDIELPELVIPKRDAPECPFCAEPMTPVDGDYVCLDCNGGSYGPETG
jgi:hypothetical protein